MLEKNDNELLKRLEKEKKKIIIDMDAIKREPHICLLTYHKLKKQKKKINIEIKRVKNKMIPDIIA